MDSIEKRFLRVKGGMLYAGSKIIDREIKKAKKDFQKSLIRRIVNGRKG